MSAMTAPMGPGLYNVSLDMLMGRDMDQDRRELLETLHRASAATSTTASADVLGEPATKRQKLQSEPPVDSAEAALRGGRKKPPWTPAEQAIVAIKHCELGNRWTQIAAYLPLRSENDVKNIWHSTLRCKDTQKRSFLRTYALAVHDHAYDYATRKAMFDIAVRQCGPPPPQAAEMIARVQLMLDHPELQASLQLQHEQAEQPPFPQLGQQPPLFQKREELSQPHLAQLQQQHLLLLQQHQQGLHRLQDGDDMEVGGDEQQHTRLYDPHRQPQQQQHTQFEDEAQARISGGIGRRLSDKDAAGVRRSRAVMENPFGEPLHRQLSDSYGAGRAGSRGDGGLDPNGGGGGSCSLEKLQELNQQIQLQQQQKQLAALLQEQAQAAAALRNQFQLGGGGGGHKGPAAAGGEVPAPEHPHQQQPPQLPQPSLGELLSHPRLQRADSGGLAGAAALRGPAANGLAIGMGCGNGNCGGNAGKTSSSSGNNDNTRTNSGTSSRAGANVAANGEEGAAAGCPGAVQADPILPLALSHAAAAVAAAAAANAAGSATDVQLPPPLALNPSGGDLPQPAPERPSGSLPAIGNLLALLYKYNIELSQASGAGGGGPEARSCQPVVLLPPMPAAADVKAATAPVATGAAANAASEAAAAPAAADVSEAAERVSKVISSVASAAGGGGGGSSTQTQGLALRPLALRPLATKPEVVSAKEEDSSAGEAAGSGLLKLKDSPTRTTLTRGAGGGSVGSLAGLPPPAPRPRGLPMSYNLQDADADELGAVEALALAARMSSQSSRAGGGGGGRLSGHGAGSAFGSVGSGRSSVSNLGGGSAGSGGLAGMRGGAGAGFGSGAGAAAGASAALAGPSPANGGSAGAAAALDLLHRTSSSSQRALQPTGRERLLLQPLHGDPPSLLQPQPSLPLPPGSRPGSLLPNLQRLGSMPQQPPTQPPPQQLMSRGGVGALGPPPPPAALPTAPPAGPSLDVVSVLNLPGLRRQVVELPPQALLALLSSPAFGVDCEASVLLLVALWVQYNAESVTSETVRAVCGAVRVAALGGFHLSAVLPQLLTDPRVVGAKSTINNGKNGDRWFDMRVEEFAFLTNFVRAGSVERAHLVDAARKVYDCTSPWYNTSPRCLAVPSEGFSFKWHIPQQGLRDALGGGVQTHAAFALNNEAASALADADGSGPDGCLALPYIMCRGLEWHLFVDCQHRNGTAGSSGASGGSAAGVFLYCRVPSALKPRGGAGGGGGADGNDGIIGVVPGGGIRLSVYGWRCGRLEEVFVWTFGDETYFTPEAAMGCPAALPLRKRPGSPAGGGGGEESLASWGDYLHEGGLRGTLTFLPLQPGSGR
ncbi:hypothetical protein Agub_g9302 [Astrephomene gubernaculifera]|uniref:Uncharacterized protein n=1 Tax=Astrephomene gubernaculifera TaxID=47775 RepID=A0AAD3DUX4_9CHLO|nr:hypothetical protein Agub_g9302 [Astrephomene gubernaculifera]